MQGALGDDTAALSKELQQATPRQSLLGGGEWDSPRLQPADGLDGLLDSMADLSTRGGAAYRHGAGYDPCGDGVGSGGCDEAPPECTAPDTPSARSQERRKQRRRHGGQQEVPVRGADDGQSPGSARSGDSGGFGACSGWCLPAARQDSMESCGGSAVK